MSLPPNGQYMRGEDMDTTVRGSATVPEFFWQEMESRGSDGTVASRYQREMVRLRTAGDNLNVPELFVTDRIRRMWPAHYNAWKQALGEHTVGTPLADWPTVTRDQIHLLHSLNVFTVEALAEVADVHLSVMGGPMMKRRAQEFVANKATTADAERLRRDKEDAEKLANLTLERLEEMQAEIAALKRERAAEADQDETVDPVKRGPGRPRKEPMPMVDEQSA